MIQKREPRHPRVNYNLPNLTATLLLKKNDLDTQYIPVTVQFIENADVPKRIASKLRKADFKGNVNLRGAEWNVYNMNEVSGMIKSWHIPKGLYIENTKQPHIVRHIAGIQFKHLLHLNLSNNNIQSIQSICSIDFPSLERLVLSYNKISSIKSLRKAYFPNLTSCCLGSNRVLQYESLSQLNAPLMKKIYQEHRADPGWCNTFTWIGKLQTNQLQGLWIASDNRIWQTESQRTFERKYIKRKQITFYVGNVEGVL